MNCYEPLSSGAEIIISSFSLCFIRMEILSWRYFRMVARTLSCINGIFSHQKQNEKRDKQILNHKTNYTLFLVNTKKKIVTKNHILQMQIFCNTIKYYINHVETAE